MIKSKDLLGIVERQKKIEAQEEMGKDETRKSRSHRSGCVTQASRLKRRGMSTTRRTSRTGRGAKLV